MSGGVDSSVAALLTKEQGYDCIGCTMKLYENEDAGVARSKTCCSLDDTEDARSVAYRLGMPFYAFNYRDAFYRQVICPFAADYEPGTLMAIGYTGGQEDGRCILETAGQASDLAVSVTKDEIKADGRGLSFVIVDLVDAEGRANHWEKKKVRFEIEGPGVLAGIGSADPSSDTSFQDPEWETYDGRVMAAIRTTCEIGEITVRVSTEGLPGKTVRVRAV